MIIITAHPVSTNFNVLEPLDINDNANVTNISCHNFNDASINLSVSGGTAPYAYSWVGPNGYSSILPNILGLSDLPYQLNILDSNGCSFSSSYNISNPSPIDTIGLALADVSCNEVMMQAYLLHFLVVHFHIYIIGILVIHPLNYQTFQLEIII